MKQILYFSAEWCSPCKSLKPLVQDVAKNLGTHITYIDVDMSPSLKDSYGITSVPTIIVENNGQQTFRRSGLMSRQDLIAAFS